MKIDPAKLARESIRRLSPYSSARHEFDGVADIFLDANENAFGSPIGLHLNRYPDPLQIRVRKKIAAMKGISPEQIFLGNGSDEAIDLLFRVFCEPGIDAAVICPPTYGMYRVAADINYVRVQEAELTAGFQLDTASIAVVSSGAKLVFICSPNNPTGNLMRREDILETAGNFPGIVVVDEAYGDFSGEPSLISEIASFPNIVVLQTFSKAWGLAGARVGMAFADQAIIELLQRIKPPYNVSELAQHAALEALDQASTVKAWITETLAERNKLADSLAKLNIVQKVYPSDSNFLLVRMADAGISYRFLLKKGIVVRNRDSVRLCEGCLRITVGTRQENERLIATLAELENDMERVSGEASAKT